MHPYLEATEGLLITEEDVRRLFLRQDKQALLDQTAWRMLWRGATAVISMLILAFMLINAPALFTKFKFYTDTEIFSNSPATQSNVGTPATIPIPGQSTTPTPVPLVVAPQKQYQDNTLYIDRINVHAPILWDVKDADILTKLQRGVAHLEGNAKPGEGGNVFIVGHSSNFVWAKGDYKHVFALLPELKVGDEITLVYHNSPIIYRVTDTKTVSANDVSVRENSGDERLTVMTCVPVGTNLQRFVAIAKPINLVKNAPQLPTQ